MSDKPVSYYEQRACFNCRHVFAKDEYDAGTEYFCNLNGGDRPWCGSVLMREPFGDGKDSKTWESWAMDRRVEAHGICSEYEEEEPA